MISPTQPKSNTHQVHDDNLRVNDENIDDLETRKKREESAKVVCASLTMQLVEMLNQLEDKRLFKTIDQAQYAIDVHLKDLAKQNNHAHASAIRDQWKLCLYSLTSFVGSAACAIGRKPEAAKVIAQIKDVGQSAHSPVYQARVTEKQGLEQQTQQRQSASDSDKSRRNLDEALKRLIESVSQQELALANRSIT